MKKFDSVLQPILQKIYTAKDLEEGKKLMLELVEETKIKELDKKKMLYEISKCHTLVKLQFYATNACFKFEGLSINSVIYK